jgi:adenylate cyclase class 2
MGHHQEIEIKLEVRNPALVKKRLRALGFRPAQRRHVERNYVFDFPDLRLRQARRLLRLRFADRKAILTFKGTPAGSRRYKVRPEIETRVEDGEGLRKILESLGLKEKFRYEKYRTVYTRTGSGEAPGPELAYDETPIGCYLELEGSRAWIDEIARKLGYKTQDYITRSYGTLFLEKRRSLALGTRDMVFHKS